MIQIRRRRTLSIIVAVLLAAPGEPSQTVPQDETSVVSEVITVGAPGFFMTHVIKAGRGNLVDAVDEVSAFIDTGAQNDADVTITTLKSTETRSGSLPSGSFQCISGKILKLVTSATLQNFEIRLYFNVNDISQFEEDTLQVFFYEDQLGQNAWIELPVDERGVDAFGTFVKAKAPRTLNPAMLRSEFLCLGGVVK